MKFSAEDLAGFSKTVKLTEKYRQEIYTKKTTKKRFGTTTKKVVRYVIETPIEEMEDPKELTASIEDNEDMPED